jgi:peptide/nickel transport system substrate-binding protein
MKPRLAMTLLAVIAAALLVGLASRSSAASLSGSRADATIPLLRVGIATGITSLDTYKANSGRTISDLGLETLMNYSPDGSLRPWLAQSVSTPSATTYIYHLRHGVKFWDGSPLTATDVAYSLNYQRAPASQMSAFYNSVQSIKPQGRYTVVVTLKHPDPNWKYDVAENVALIFEKKFQQAHAASFGQPGTLVMGTGPWKIDSFDPTSGAELSANPHWWGGKVPIKHISFKFFSDENSEALAFRAGQIDLIPPGAGGPGTSSPVQNPRSFSSTAPNATLVTTQTCTMFYVAMNTQIAPWNDVHVRRAVAYALNPADLIRANGGYAVPLSTVINNQMLGTVFGSPKQVQALVKTLPKYQTSMAKAKAELAKSAYPNGFSYTFEEFNGLNFPTLAQAVAGELAPLGIKIGVNVVPVGTWIADAETSDKRPAGVSALGCTGPDASTIDQVVGTKSTGPGGYNQANYSTPAVDKLVAQGDTTVNVAKRQAIYKKLLTIVGNDVPYAPFMNSIYTAAVAKKFSWRIYPDSYFNGTWALSVKPK